MFCAALSFVLVSTSHRNKKDLNKCVMRIQRVKIELLLCICVYLCSEPKLSIQKTRTRRIHDEKYQMLNNNTKVQKKREENEKKNRRNEIVIF